MSHGTLVSFLPHQETKKRVGHIFAISVFFNFCDIQGRIAVRAGIKLCAYMLQEGYHTSVSRVSLCPADSMTLEGIALVTCVRIYLGADSARRYLCPPVTVSVSFRFHSL